MRYAKEYRILESLGKFYIQGLFPKYETKSFRIFWSKTEYVGDEWVIVDEYGTKPMYAYSLFKYINPPLDAFNSLSEAKEYVKIMIKGNQIHEIE